MTGISHSSDGLDSRRRRARYRAWHRGTREMDLLLGRFADAQIANLGDHDLADFEALMAAPDGDLFDWIARRAPAAPGYETPLLNAIIAFHAARNEDC